MGHPTCGCRGEWVPGAVRARVVFSLILGLRRRRAGRAEAFGAGGAGVIVHTQETERIAPALLRRFVCEGASLGEMEDAVMGERGLDEEPR